MKRLLLTVQILVTCLFVGCGSQTPPTTYVYVPGAGKTDSVDLVWCSEVPSCLSACQALCNPVTTGCGSLVQACVSKRVPRS